MSRDEDSSFFGSDKLEFVLDSRPPAVDCGAVDSKESMGGVNRSPKGLLIALVSLTALAAAAYWLPRWWARRVDRQERSLAGIGAPVLPGAVTEARRRIDPGRSARQVVDAIGRPSVSIGTEGSSTHEIWTYYYADGTIRINLTDGIAQRISLEYGPPTPRRR
jgi:hypothetical protein